MFRPVNRSSSSLQQNKSQVLFRYWDPNIFTAVNVHKNWYWIKCATQNVLLKQIKTRVDIWHCGSVFVTLRVLTGLWLLLYFQSVRWYLCGTTVPHKYHRSMYVHNCKNIGIPISKLYLRLIPMEAWWWPVNRPKHVAYISAINICCSDVSSQFVI